MPEARIVSCSWALQIQVREMRTDEFTSKTIGGRRGRRSDDAGTARDALERGPFTGVSGNYRLCDLFAGTQGAAVHEHRKGTREACGRGAAPRDHDFEAH